MKYWLTSIMILILLKDLSYSNYHDRKIIDDLRILFYSSVQEEDSLPKFKNKLISTFGKEESCQNPLGIAYWGAYRTLIAKHAFNPYTKLNELQNGLELITKAIEKDSHNLEIRFLRFSVLHHIPDFLGYNDEKKSDIDKIYNLLLRQEFNNLDYKFQKGIAEFLIRSKRINKNQIENLTKIFSK